jgi:hypothetical protein
MEATRSGRAAARFIAVTCCGLSIIGAASPKPGVTVGFPGRFRLRLDWHPDGEEPVSEEVHAPGTMLGGSGRIEHRARREDEGGEGLGLRLRIWEIFTARACCCTWARQQVRKEAKVGG